jgi:hypothetical protein
MRMVMGITTITIMGTTITTGIITTIIITIMGMSMQSPMVISLKQVVVPLWPPVLYDGTVFLIWNRT